MIAAALGAAMLCPAAASANAAKQAFDRGKTLLDQGDFEGALGAYAQAARADRENRQYVAQYSLVRQVVELRKRLDAEQDPKQWENTARALRSFYLREGIYREALALDGKVHARLATAATARMLAETQLALDMNGEAAETLASLDPEKVTPSTQGLLVVALARQGKQDDARKVAASVAVPSQPDARADYTLAWMYAAAGEPVKSLDMLTRAFEGFPPSLLPGYKAHAKACPEFAALPSAELAKVMATESKVPESKCSGGSSCAGCPNRGKCAHAQGAQ
jgi:tetratricopeptide (TPR) repeat protein